jgi:hypothetical protein
MICRLITLRVLHRAYNIDTHNILMDEQYVYLGCQNDTFFFMHIVSNPEFKKETTDQIYNIMMHESRIISSNKNVVIYEFDMANIVISAIIIQHISKLGGPIQFDKENLQTFFRSVVSADRNDMYVIRYNYEKKCFQTFELDSDIISSTIEYLPKEDMTIDDIRYIVTRKQMANSE